MRRREVAAEVKAGDTPLRPVVYERLRKDKPAAEVRREVPIGKTDDAVRHSVVTRDGGLCPHSGHCPRRARRAQMGGKRPSRFARPVMATL